VGAARRPTARVGADREDIETRMTVMNLEARYVDACPLEGSPAWVVGIWCELNGRLRHFTAENVKELQGAGHHFYVQDAEHEACGIRVVGASAAAHMRTGASGIEGNALADLPVRGGDGARGTRNHPA
jgi:hypothetical protein